MIRLVSLKLLALYQRFFTLLGYGSCRYYPTCSSYAKLLFTYDRLDKALLKSALRIGRCNHLFKGGIEYPIISFTPPTFTLTRKNDHVTFQIWIIPLSSTKAYIIPSL